MNDYKQYDIINISNKDSIIKAVILDFNCTALDSHTWQQDFLLYYNNTLITAYNTCHYEEYRIYDDCDQLLSTDVDEYETELEIKDILAVPCYIPSLDKELQN